MAANKAIFHVNEKTVAALLAEAVARRVCRDFDTLDDDRSNRELLLDFIRRAKAGNKELIEYLQEIIEGSTGDISGCYTIVIAEV